MSHGGLSLVAGCGSVVRISSQSRRRSLLGEVRTRMQPAEMQHFSVQSQDDSSLTGCLCFPACEMVTKSPVQFTEQYSEIGAVGKSEGSRRFGF